jgi:hypothetical protein
MFCPGCGIEDLQSNQFCRACGTDMRPVRTALARADSITESAESARDEIGRAVAAKIRETRSAKELAKVTEEILPEIEKFLESPEERKLRRLRAGTILSSVGLGVAIALSIVGAIAGNERFLFLAGLGCIAFFLGLGFVLNGLFLSVPKKRFSDRSFDADSQRELDAEVVPPTELQMPAVQSLFSTSVTEHTTKHLREEQLHNRE